MELTAILAKTIATGMPKLIGLAMKKALQRKEIVEFLRNHGHTNHEDEFSIHYVHALVIRGKAGTKEPMLRILGDKDVIPAFRETWPSDDLSAFIVKVQWAVDSLAQGDQVRQQAIDVAQEARAFVEAFRQAVDEARTTSGQETHAVASDTNKEVKELPQGHRGC